MSEVRLRGRPASPGIAAGPIAVLGRKGTERTAVGDPGQEAVALKKAMAAAAGELSRLAERAPDDAAQILGFQLAILEDEALYGPALMAIAAGEAADCAWRAALDVEIAGYEAAEDEHFRTRASDLKDLRDRVLAHLSGATADVELPAGAVLAGDDLPPSRFLAVDWSRGGAILLSSGSPMSHVAVLARSRGVPMIVGLGDTLGGAAGEAIVDGGAGEAVLNPSQATIRAFEERRAAENLAAAEGERLLKLPAATRDGTRIQVYLNLAGAEELASLDAAICDGIGLVRTEFLFQGRALLPDEDAQYDIYRRIVQWACGRPVTFRTLDAGGDKPIPGLTRDGESNPFLGTRGIRLSLLHPAIFRQQLRALIRASAHGTVKIMLPMVTVPEEVAAARAMLEEEIEALMCRGLAVRRPQLGIMVEVPAAALAPGAFEADFLSIGSNDLTQYLTAAGRDIGAVADLANPLHPGVIRVIEEVARFGRERNVEVSLCGDAGGDPALIPHLLRAGVRSLSMAPGVVGKAKAAIAATDLED